MSVTKLAPRSKKDFVKSNLMSAVTSSPPKPFAEDVTQRVVHEDYGTVPIYIQERKAEMAEVTRLAEEKGFPSSAAEKAAISADTTNKHYSKAVAATYHESLLEVASTSQSKVGVTGAASACEVCVYVVENTTFKKRFCEIKFNVSSHFQST